MLQTKKISDNLCAVAFAADEIMIRKSGKRYFGQEKTLVSMKNGKLVVNKDVAAKFGIEIVLEETQGKKQEV